jgi:hypothetical protein
MLIKISTYDENDRIKSAFVRNHFMWDYMSDVRWDIVKSAVSSAETVLINSDKFPFADFDYQERISEEVGDFLAINLLDWRVSDV